MLYSNENMIYPNNFEQRIGIDTIRQFVTEKCLSTLGEEKVAAMDFSTDYATIARWLEQTGEFLQILRNKEDFPVDFFLDVRDTLQRIGEDITAWLSEEEIAGLMNSLHTISNIVAFLHNARTDTGRMKYPSLTFMAGQITVFPLLIDKANSILDKSCQVKDNASRRLADIRRDKVEAAKAITRNMQIAIREAQAAGLIGRDVQPSLREGHMLIPVNAANKRKIKGVVHADSGSGKTVFIEPEAVAAASSRLRELENDERREVARILIEFTNLVRPHLADLMRSYLFMGEMDFIRAKASFALRINGIKPVFENEQQVEWIQAVHPLLNIQLRQQNKEAFPLDIRLNRKDRLLIVSGANAGGKSLCLKTVALLQYMLQCGLLIPVDESSRTGIFDHIFVDIGDGQSIENSLSTYTSHLTNMKFFVENCDNKTLILIDEFGSGTEPQIGGAIAETILDRFNRKHSFGVITTHFQNLKHFAEDHEGVVNGAMLYDRHEMRALFQLQIGNPGSSFAVEIARKIGLPEEVIADASEIVGSEYIQSDKYLQDIVRDKRYWETKRQNIRKREKQMEDTITRYEQEIQELERSRKEILKKAKEEAERLLQESNAKIENTIRTIKEAQAEKERTRTARQELTDFKQQVENLEKAALEEKIARKMEKLREKQERKKDKKAKQANAPETPVSPKVRPIEAGDYVRIKGQTSVGQVMEISGKNAVVMFGLMKTNVKAERLERAEAPKQSLNTAKATFVSSETQERMYEKKLNFKQDIDVRGMRGDEAIQAVTYFIDDAILVGVSRVRILHGTGTGILRTLIRQYLATVPGVKHFQDEHVQFGGAGITVVDLK